MTTRYRQHVDRWRGCTKCELHRARTNVVLVRGSLPADVLFIGEGPGSSEDVLGRPFVGPAGKLMDKIIEFSLREGPGYALTNLVCCIPLDEDGSKATDPPEAAIRACSPRLQEFIELCKPSCIIGVGKLASKWVPKLLGVKCHGEITHPAAILRMDVSQRGLAIQRAVVAIEEAWESV